jgi:hypothetical protein
MSPKCIAFFHHWGQWANIKITLVIRWQSHATKHKCIFVFKRTRYFSYADEIGQFANIKITLAIRWQRHATKHKCIFVFKRTRYFSYADEIGQFANIKITLAIRWQRHATKPTKHKCIFVFKRTRYLVSYARDISRAFEHESAFVVSCTTLSPDNTEFNAHVRIWPLESTLWYLFGVYICKKCKVFQNYW